MRPSPLDLDQHRWILPLTNVHYTAHVCDFCVVASQHNQQVKQGQSSAGGLQRLAELVGGGGCADGFGLTEDDERQQ
jgi:hypothetical protein